MRPALAVCLGIALLSPLAARAETRPQPNDYSRDDAWLCRPGRADACSAPLTTTVVPAESAPSRVELAPAANPPIDCFYVYPTVSREPTPNADMTAGPEEEAVAHVQFAAFGQVCRLFAPLYRQTTLATLQPSGPAGDPDLAYGDVRDAWEYYLTHDNRGRGVVLIGHSQGAALLSNLVKYEIDPAPGATPMVSAILSGTVIGVPTGKHVGGTFVHTPLCGRPDQTGCVVAYSTYRAENPPPENGYFGKAPYPGLSAACVNPAALAGGSAALGAEMPVTPRVASDLHIDTTFIRLPGLLTGACVTTGDLSYLAVTVGTDRRAALERLALMAAETTPGWGLHVLDMNLVLDDLVGMVKAEAAAWTAAHPIRQ